MPPDRRFLQTLATAFLAGPLTVEDISQRTTSMLRKPYRWVRPLATRFVTSLNRYVRPRRRTVMRWMQHDRGLNRAWEKNPGLWLVGYRLAELQPAPIEAAKNCGIPKVESIGELAKWFGFEAEELEWFADVGGFEYRRDDSPLSHYHYRLLTKRSGNIRLIEVPKSRLKEAQRKILSEILNRVPPHNVVHGFVKGRSIKTFIAPHVNRSAVLRMDLCDFFPTFRAARIQTMFCMLGYPERIATLLAGICTHKVPLWFWEQKPWPISAIQWRELRELYARPHLPQGTPTSPSLANLCFYRVDCRLEGLARSTGAAYTRYADDLAFSGGGEFARTVERFSTHVAAILLEEGFSVNFHKTRVMRQGVQQRLVGLVANEHINIPRFDFDRLKAMLTNCVRSGPESQNRDGHPEFRLHLDGRVRFVESINPRKGERLRKMFKLIAWP